MIIAKVDFGIYLKQGNEMVAITCDLKINLFHVVQSLKNLYIPGKEYVNSFREQNLKHDLKNHKMLGRQCVQLGDDPLSVYKEFLDTDIHDSSY